MACMADICARVGLGQGRSGKRAIPEDNNCRQSLVAPSTDGKFPDRSQVELNPRIAGTGLGCLLERELAQAE